MSTSSRRFGAIAGASYSGDAGVAVETADRIAVDVSGAALDLQAAQAAKSVSALASLLARYGLTIRQVGVDQPIPGSFWGDEEAGAAATAGTGLRR